MLGKRGTGAVLAIVDRKTKQTLLQKLESSGSSEANQKTYEKITSSKLKCLSMTNDNGPEFGEFWKLEPLIGAKVYFSHPLCPWERGTVENTIGLLRQYIPKGSDLTHLTDEDLKQIEKYLDSRPRKSLGFLTPNEIATGKMRKLIPKKRIEIQPPEYYEQFY
jgi:IS30 family transposase